METLEEMHERIVKGFLDMAIMVKLMKGNPVSGHDVVTFFPKKFGFQISPGTVYSVLYSMERDGLIKGRWSQRKRVYTLTNKGEKKIKAISEAKEKILGLMVNLFI